MTDPLGAVAGLTVPDVTPSPGVLPVMNDLIAIGWPNGNILLIGADRPAAA